MTILLAILQGIIIGIISKVWNAMHPLLGMLTGFLLFFVTMLISMPIGLILEKKLPLGDIGFWTFTFMVSLTLALGFLRIIKRINEDK